MKIKHDELERILNIAAVCIRRIYRDGGRILMDTSELKEPVLQEDPVPILIIPAEWLNTASGEEIIKALANAEWDIRRTRSGRQ